MNGAYVRDLWFNTTMDWSTDVVGAVAGPLVPARFAGRGRATVDVRQNRLSIVRVEPLLHSWPSKG